MWEPNLVTRPAAAPASPLGPGSASGGTTEQISPVKEVREECVIQTLTAFSKRRNEGD